MSDGFRPVDAAGNRKEISSGCLCSRIRPFSFIYQFIARNVERNGQHVQVVLLSMELPKDREISLERIEDSLVLLESAIVRSLRRGDVTSRFSSTQQVVVLMDASKEDGVMVANRILKNTIRLLRKQQLQHVSILWRCHMLFLKGQKKRRKGLTTPVKYAILTTCKEKTLQVVLLCRRKNRYLS